MTLWGHIRRLFGLRPREVWQQPKGKPPSIEGFTREVKAAGQISPEQSGDRKRWTM